MKNKCAHIQEIIFSSRDEEINSEETGIIRRHLETCDDCRKVYNEIKRTDGLLGRIKKSPLLFNGEEKLTASIMKKISAREIPDAAGPLDQLMDFLSAGKVRFALGLVLLMTMLSFGYMEYSDTKKIVSLEQKIGSQWNQTLVYAGVLREEESVLKFFYDAYKLFKGKRSYLEINQELVLIKTEDLRALLDDYSKLDEAAKIRLNEMRNRFLKDTSLVNQPGADETGISADRNNVEKLTKELEKRISKRGLK